MIKKTNILLLVVFVTVFFAACKYEKFTPPKSNFTDKQLYDSCKNTLTQVAYRNNPGAVYSGSHGPHGAFKLQFNKIAALALTDGGKLPEGKSFPDGSLIIKEVQPSGLFAFMYKNKSNWLWGEANADGSTVFSIHSSPTTACISCHNQTGQRDLAVSFHFY